MQPLYIGDLLLAAAHPLKVCRLGFENYSEQCRNRRVRGGWLVQEGAVQAGSLQWLRPQASWQARAISPHVKARGPSKKESSTIEQEQKQETKERKLAGARNCWASQQSRLQPLQRR